MLVLYLLIGVILTIVYLYAAGEGKKDIKIILTLLFAWPVFVYFYVKAIVDGHKGSKTE